MLTIEKDRQKPSSRRHRSRRSAGRRSDAPSMDHLLRQTNPATGNAAAVDCLFGFTGRAFDTATGLQNNLNRWYDASVGRWISPDPTGFTAGDTNEYRYVGNSPIDGTDPSGEADQPPPSSVEERRRRDWNEIYARNEREHPGTVLLNGLRFKHGKMFDDQDTGHRMIHMQSADGRKIDLTLREYYLLAYGFDNTSGKRLDRLAAAQIAAQSIDGRITGGEPLVGSEKPLFDNPKSPDDLDATTQEIWRASAHAVVDQYFLADAADSLAPRLSRPIAPPGGTARPLFLGDAGLPATRIVIKGAPDAAHEAAEAIRLGKLLGGGEFDFYGNFSQGVEGVFRPAGGTDSIPFSLKSYNDVERLGSLLKDIRRTSNEAIAAGVKDGIFFAEPTKFSAAQLAGFAVNGPLSKEIIRDGAFSRIILQASDGVVEITRSGVKIIR